MTRHVLFWPTVTFLVVLVTGGLVFAFLLSRNNQTEGSEYRTATVTVHETDVSVRIPLTPAAQARGLGGVTRLSANEGMMWVYDPAQLVSFWMKDMKIPLDFIWIRDGQVIGVTANVPPPSAGQGSLPIYHPPRPVDRVLEVAAGFAAAHDITAGVFVAE